MTLAGKVCVITGASRGIGADTAVALGGAGACVVIASRSEEARDPKMPGTIHEVAARVEAAGGQALAFRCDVSKDEEVEALVQATLDRFHRVDVLINNAAIQVPGDILSFQPRHLDLIWRVDLRAPVMLCRAFLPAMIAGGGGHILNISSRGAVMPLPGPYEPVATRGNSFYGMVKAGLERFSVGLARELAVNRIAVNVLSPEGRIKTPGSAYMRENAGRTEDLDLDFEPATDMVKATLWLLDQDPALYTGHVLFDRELIQEQGL
jgi:NAD(P)-dependent dehydrogenase (short-subunit alcohol dehydrogenase family)